MQFNNFFYAYICANLDELLQDSHYIIIDKTNVKNSSYILVIKFVTMHSERASFLVEKLLKDVLSLGRGALDIYFCRSKIQKNREHAIVTSKPQDSLFHGKFRVLEGARKNVAAALAFSLSLASHAY